MKSPIYKCDQCRKRKTQVIVPDRPKYRKNRPYMDGYAEYLCPACIAKAQRDYIKRVPLEEVPLLFSVEWIFKEIAHKRIKERLGF